ncbi:uncharacterized protein AB675_7029 [Cyphellophora attinorum]|uniref:F-box domain-containing protein n=1 Tax=Cyphellophora attinorum TaxID=1664694 RepID=A0A0N1H8N2_9EURO|nr:uncharacterized protein AB675_7029 [Phialophora attinorum]KPI43464.1 hypothetical protein AB675_7029 [Phialophora attinorum]
MAPKKAAKKSRSLGPRTQNARFAALIRHVKKKRAAKTSVRLFRLSKKVAVSIHRYTTLTLCQILNEGARMANVTINPLGTLPQELFIHIAGNLEASSLICLSLTSKAFAYKTASFQEKMVSNISQSFEPSPTGRAERGARQKALVGVKETRALIGRYLGRENYRYCHACEKFRPISERFWYDLFENRTPPVKVEGRRGIGRGMVENFPEDPAEQQAKIEDLLDKWAMAGLAGTHASHPLPTCPAHVYADKLYRYTIRD